MFFFKENGMLYVRSQRRNFNDREYTSGRIDTKDKFQLLYGEVELRAKLPKGKGLWPSLWLLQHQCPPACPSLTWPPELDIMQARGDLTNTVTFANHYGRYPANSYTVSSFSGPDFTENFHTFKVIWDPNKIIW